MKVYFSFNCLMLIKVNVPNIPKCEEDGVYVPFGSLTFTDVNGSFNHLLKQLWIRLPATSTNFTAMGFGQELKCLEDKSPITTLLWTEV